MDRLAPSSRPAQVDHRPRTGVETSLPLWPISFSIRLAIRGGLFSGFGNKCLASNSPTFRRKEKRYYEKQRLKDYRKCLPSRLNPTILLDSLSLAAYFQSYVSYLVVYLLCFFKCSHKQSYGYIRLYSLSLRDKLASKPHFRLYIHNLRYYELKSQS